VGAGSQDAEYVAADPDFASLRDHPEFPVLLVEMRERGEAADL